MNAEYMIRTEDLTKVFGNFTAVDKMNIEIMPGQIFGFLGANGAGKTTAIRMLCGLLKPSSGKAMVAGYDVRVDSEAIKRKIGYMSQRFSLYDDLSIGENIRFYSGIYQVPYKVAMERAKDSLKMVGLDLSMKVMTGSLPLGFKQRLALVCALLHDPPLLILDEPTSGVDPMARRAFWNVINSLAEQGKTIIVSTHFMDEAEYCHRLIIMRSGSVLVDDSPRALKEKYGSRNMQELFLLLAGAVNE
ncbi:MAG: ABC transporter ATP-binding protein [Candidatus Cloacimonetes bacterium HGW-Cloacimonetes-1]|nr:MAG: ABC transporter ATP-binding protein [Candidatus Cloacimonetes bacterium HGW-Cloacimonetes-1]